MGVVPHQEMDKNLNLLETENCDSVQQFPPVNIFLRNPAGGCSLTMDNGFISALYYD